jgi:hypothetical protein
MSIIDKREEGLKAANNLLQKTNANPVITSGHPDFSEDMLLLAAFKPSSRLSTTSKIKGLMVSS